MCFFRYTYYSHCKHEQFVLLRHCGEAKSSAVAKLHKADGKAEEKEEADTWQRDPLNASPESKSHRRAQRSIDHGNSRGSSPARPQSLRPAYVTRSEQRERERGRERTRSVSIRASSFQTPQTPAQLLAARFHAECDEMLGRMRADGTTTALPENDSKATLAAYRGNRPAPLTPGLPNPATPTDFPALSPGSPSPSTAASSSRQRATSWAEVVGITSPKNIYAPSDAETASTTITSDCSVPPSPTPSSGAMAKVLAQARVDAAPTIKSHGRLESRSPRKGIPEHWTKEIPSGDPKKKSSPAKSTAAHGPVLATAQRAAAREELHRTPSPTKMSYSAATTLRRKTNTAADDETTVPPSPSRIPRLKLKTSPSKAPAPGSEARTDKPLGTSAAVHAKGDDFSKGEDWEELYGDDGAVRVELPPPAQATSASDASEPSRDPLGIIMAPGIEDPEETREATVDSPEKIQPAAVDNPELFRPSTPTEESRVEHEASFPAGQQWAVHYGHDLAAQSMLQERSPWSNAENIPNELIELPRRQAPQTSAPETPAQGPPSLLRMPSKTSFNVEAQEFIPSAFSVTPAPSPFAWQIEGHRTPTQKKTPKKKGNSSKKKKKSVDLRLRGTAGYQGWGSWEDPATQYAPRWYNQAFEITSETGPTFASFYKPCGLRGPQRTLVRTSDAGLSPQLRSGGEGKADEGAEYIGYGLRGGCGKGEVTFAGEITGGICGRCWPDEHE